MADAQLAERQDGAAAVDETNSAYGVLAAAFNASLAGVLTAASRSHRLPERIDMRDLVLLGVATHKLARIVTKDRVTRPLRAPFTEVEGKGAPGELEERPRGRGTRRAVGELLTCPYCIGAWVANGFLTGRLLAPRETRAVASLFVAVAISDFLQLAYRALERRA